MNMIRSVFLNNISRQVRLMSTQLGGATKGVDAGGRKAGSSYILNEATKEEEYFYNQRKEQLKALKASLHDEIRFHEEQIRRHQEAVDRHKKKIREVF